MKYVPENRLLIQPTVQLKWIEQHQSIEFKLPEELQRSFDEIWCAYCAGGHENIASFLADSKSHHFELHQHDALFALLTGADYISNLYDSFQCKVLAPNLVWSI